MDGEYVTGGIGTIQWQMKTTGFDFYRQALADYSPKDILGEMSEEQGMRTINLLLDSRDGDLIALFRTKDFNGKIELLSNIAGRFLHRVARGVFTQEQAAGLFESLQNVPWPELPLVGPTVFGEDVDLSLFVEIVMVVYAIFDMAEDDD